MLTLLIILKYLFLITAVCVIIVVLFLKFAPTFGSKPNSSSQDRINNSPNFDNEKKVFKNLIDTQASSIKIDNLNGNSEDTHSGGLISNLLFPQDGKNPKLVNTIELDLLNNPLQNGEFVWMGHSTVLFKVADKVIITDPVFHAASPVSLFVRPFKTSNSVKPTDLPYIDIVLLSHDHYDHLDHKTITQIHDNVGHFYVPLGVKGHLQGWGVADDKITEFDWYEEITLPPELQQLEKNQTVNTDDIRLIFTPTRHFSGRGFGNHGQTLWGSWVVKSPELSIYFSGDGGYSPEFSKIGEKYGDFDIAFIEDGAYNVRWQDVHMLPEQSAQAGIDVGAKVVLPIHWGKFDLSTHEWHDPVQRIKTAMDKHNQNLADDQKIRITTPRIGQRFNLDDIPTESWWE